jgi:hypothetical protein
MSRRTNGHKSAIITCSGVLLILRDVCRLLLLLRCHPCSSSSSCNDPVYGFAACAEGTKDGGFAARTEVQIPLGEVRRDFARGAGRRRFPGGSRGRGRMERGRRSAAEGLELLRPGWWGGRWLRGGTSVCLCAAGRRRIRRRFPATFVVVVIGRLVRFRMNVAQSGMVDGQLGVRVEDVERASSSSSEDLSRTTFALEVAAALRLFGAIPTREGQALQELVESVIVIVGAEVLKLFESCPRGCDADFDGPDALGSLYDGGIVCSADVAMQGARRLEQDRGSRWCGWTRFVCGRKRERDERICELQLQLVGVPVCAVSHALPASSRAKGAGLVKANSEELVDRLDDSPLAAFSLWPIHSSIRAAMTTEATRSLYRSFWRGLALVARSNGARTANLRRLYRSQLRHALLSSTDHAQVRQTSCVSSISPLRVKDRVELTPPKAVHRTLTLLGSSPALTANLASLAYHHTPDSIPANRPIVWNPQEPLAAEKAHHKRRRDAERDPAVRIGDKVEAGLERMWREAERTGGGRVWLGRITETGHGAAAAEGT